MTSRATAADPKRVNVAGHSSATRSAKLIASSPEKAVRWSIPVGGPFRLLPVKLIGCVAYGE